ncbi:MAG: hypothetical protein WBA23_17425 [Tunicatimonas sp.]|uniref:response regulator n=1 Tax=Tunicatimonas sp. TaxID=1940096 RepID=UPI003C71DB39
MVLMIDDDLDTLEIYQIIAAKSSHAHHFKVFSSPVAALHWLKRQVFIDGAFPRYLLLALNMAELHGFEFLEEFERKLPYQQLDTKVFVLSNSIRYLDQSRSKKYDSVSEFISKPLSIERFYSLLESASDIHTIKV